MHNLCHIDKDISLGYDTTGEIITSTIHQMLMDEVDVEVETIFHTIERTMKNYTNRALFLEPNNDLCMAILDDIKSWVILSILMTLRHIAKMNMPKCLIQPLNSAKVNNMFNLALMHNIWYIQY
jgi:hypothetical protein